MIVRGVELFLGLEAEGSGPAWGPLRQITSICGLTLQGGMEEDLGGATEGSEADQPARNRDHLRLVAHRRTP